MYLFNLLTRKQPEYLYCMLEITNLKVIVDKKKDSGKQFYILHAVPEEPKHK